MNGKDEIASFIGGVLLYYLFTFGFFLFFPFFGFFFWFLFPVSSFLSIYLVFWD